MREKIELCTKKKKRRRMKFIDSMEILFVI